MTPAEILTSARAIWADRPFKGGILRPLGDGRLEMYFPEKPENADTEQEFIEKMRAALPITHERVGNLLRFDGWCRCWTLTLERETGIEPATASLEG